MFLQFISFLHTDKTQVVEILPRERPGISLYPIAITMAADDLVT